MSKEDSFKTPTKEVFLGEIWASDSSSELHNAANRGDLSYVKNYVSRSTTYVNVNIVDEKSKLTPLHLASYKGFVDIMEELIKNGADVNLRDNLGRTALHFACIRGNLEGVKLLVESGADINLVDLTRSRKKPIDYAVEYERKEVVDYLNLVEKYKRGEVVLIKNDLNYQVYRRAKTPYYFKFLNQNSSGTFFDFLYGGFIIANYRFYEGNTYFSILNESAYSEFSRNYFNSTNFSVYYDSENLFFK